MDIYPPRKPKCLKACRNWLLNSWPLYALLRALLFALNLLPLGLARGLGRAGGWLAYRLDRRHRPICLRNLEIAFPEKSEAARRAILKRSYGHLGIALADAARFMRLRPKDLRADWIVFEDGAEARVRAALAQGRGAINASAHIGFWELGGFAYPALFGPITCVAKTVSCPRLNAFFNRIRQGLGQKVVSREGGSRSLLRALKNKQSAGVLMDQYAGEDAPRIPFFSLEASTADTCARLHLRTGAPLLCTLLLRRPDGRYTWRARLIDVPAQPGEHRSRHLRRILGACNQEFEAALREFPEQWLWMYKRWKDRRPRQRRRAPKRKEGTAAPETLQIDA